MTEPLDRRVEILESDLKAFRADVRDEFAKVIERMDTMESELRREIREIKEDLRREIKASNAEAIQRSRELMDTLKTDLRREIKESFDGAERHGRVLHEELRGLIKTMGEGTPRRPRKPRQP